MTQLSHQIKQLRTANHLSQEDLSEKLYISRQSISKWETGEATPDVDKLVQLAEIFEVSLNYLVLGKGPEKEIVVEQGRQMNVWECLSEYWWVVSILMVLAFGLFSVAMKVIQMFGYFLTKLANRQAFFSFFCYNSHD